MLEPLAATAGIGQHTEPAIANCKTGHQDRGFLSASPQVVPCVVITEHKSSARRYHKAEIWGGRDAELN